MKKCTNESGRLIKLSTAIHYTTHDDNIFKHLHITLVQRQTQTRPITSDVSVRVLKQDLASVSLTTRDGVRAKTSKTKSN